MKCWCSLLHIFLFQSSTGPKEIHKMQTLQFFRNTGPALMSACVGQHDISSSPLNLHHKHVSHWVHSLPGLTRSPSLNPLSGNLYRRVLSWWGGVLAEDRSEWSRGRKLDQKTDFLLRELKKTTLCLMRRQLLFLVSVFLICSEVLVSVCHRGHLAEALSGFIAVSLQPTVEVRKQRTGQMTVRSRENIVWIKIRQLICLYVIFFARLVCLWSSLLCIPLHLHVICVNRRVCVTEYD